MWHARASMRHLRAFMRHARAFTRNAADRTFSSFNSSSQCGTADDVTNVNFNFDNLHLISLFVHLHERVMEVSPFQKQSL